MSTHGPASLPERRERSRCKKNADASSFAKLAGLLVIAFSAVGCGTSSSSQPAANEHLHRAMHLQITAGSQPAPAPDSDEAKARASFEMIAKLLGKQGVYKTPGVYVVTVPRDDLALAIDGMEVPTAAGIESVFNFYYCPCGKTNVVGQFCVLDYEINDVIDALRAAKIEIVSVAPMLLHTRNAPVAVRFFAESKPEPLGKAIREAMRWTGKERMAPQE